MGEEAYLYPPNGELSELKDRDVGVVVKHVDFALTAIILSSKGCENFDDINLISVRPYATETIIY
jgi:hypothetical protein